MNQLPLEGQKAIKKKVDAQRLEEHKGL
jgi:hypothetical protein